MFLALFRDSADLRSYRVSAAPNPEAKHGVSCQFCKICGMRHKSMENRPGRDHLGTGTGPYLVLVGVTQPYWCFARYPI